MMTHPISLDDVKNVTKHRDGTFTFRTEYGDFAARFAETKVNDQTKKRFQVDVKSHTYAHSLSRNTSGERLYERFNFGKSSKESS